MIPRSVTSSNSIPAWLVVLLAVAWILPGLVGHEPWKPDEAYSFGLVYHILQTGDLVVPTLAGEPFMEKPPLFYLTAALFAKLLSPWLPLHDGAHLAAGFYVTLTLIFTALTARELYGRGIVAALALLACLGLAPWAHLLITDTALLAGLALGFYGLALALRRRIMGGLLLGTGTGVAFLAKGLLGPGLLGLLALSLPLLAPAWRTRAYLSALLAAAVAVLPWLVIWPMALYIHSPHLFTEWLWDNNFGRFFGTSGLGPKQETFFYLRILPWFAWPAWLLALWAIWMGRRSLGQPAILLPLVAFALTFFVLIFAADARQVYALPLLLPLALLAVPALEQMPRWAANGMYALGAAATIAVAALVWLSWSALEFGAPAALLPRLEAAAHDGGTGVPLAVVMLAAAYTLAAGVLLYALRHMRERPVASWAVVTTLAMGLSMTLLLGWLDERKGYHRAFTALRQALPESYRCIASHGLGEPQRAMLHYYTGIKTHRLAVSPKTNCDLLLRQEWVTEGPHDPREWCVLWEGQRPGDVNEKFRLYQKY